MQPEIKTTQSPRSEETTEPTPGTSGMQQKPESREKSVERYKSAEKATIMSPEGKLIPFRKLRKDEGQENESKPETPKYKYIL